VCVTRTYLPSAAEQNYTSQPINFFGRSSYILSLCNAYCFALAMHLHAPPPPLRCRGILSSLTPECRFAECSLTGRTGVVRRCSAPVSCLSSMYVSAMTLRSTRDSDRRSPVCRAKLDAAQARKRGGGR